MKNKVLFWSVLLFCGLIISACLVRVPPTEEPARVIQTEVSEVPQPTAEAVELTVTPQTEEIPQTTAEAVELTVKPLSVEPDSLEVEILEAVYEEGLVRFIVRYTLGDWRDWKIARAKLEAAGKEFDFSSEHLEGNFLQRDGSVRCGTYHDGKLEYDCVLSYSNPFLTDSLTFTTGEIDLNKPMRLKILEFNAKPNEGQLCKVIDLEAFRAELDLQFPGIELTCSDDPAGSGIWITPGTAYAENAEAIDATHWLFMDYTVGENVSIWEFDIRKK